MPEISVIIPVYNSERYIHKCVDSILSQSFEDFELILIDDGSTDASGDICEEYVLKDNRIKAFHQENRGQASARNFALDWIFANSDSKYISFVDSDDWVHPRFLELLREGILRFQVNICQCRYLETNGTETIPEVFETVFCITPDEQFLQYYSAFMWDKLFSRRCWEEIRFPEGQIYEDVAIWYKLLFSEQKLTLVDEVLYYYYTNPNSTVRKNWTIRHFARIEAWDAIVDYLSDYKNNSVLSNAVYRYCHIARRQFDEIGQSRVVNVFTKWKYRARIKYRIVWMMIKHKNEMVNNDSYLYFFEWSFPVLGWLYWTFKGIAGRIHKKRS